MGTTMTLVMGVVWVVLYRTSTLLALLILLSTNRLVPEDKQHWHHKRLENTYLDNKVQYATDNPNSAWTLLGDIKGNTWILGRASGRQAITDL